MIEDNHLGAHVRGEGAGMEGGEVVGPLQVDGGDLGLSEGVREDHHRPQQSPQ